MVFLFFSTVIKVGAVSQRSVSNSGLPDSDEIVSQERFCEHLCQ